MKKLIIFTIALVLLWCGSALGLEGPYYFKAAGNDSNTGLSDAQAWLTPKDKIDGVEYDEGTDFYFKQGETFTTPSRIDVMVSGVDGNNRSIFGCYEADGDFDCSGARPIIQCSHNHYQVFNIHDEDYLTFVHLDIQNSSPIWEDCVNEGSNEGIASENGSSYITVTDCNFYHLGHYALILYGTGGHNIITDNTLDTVGNAIYLGNEDKVASSSYNYIANNTATNVVGYATCGDPGTKKDGHGVGLQRISLSIIEDNAITDSIAPIVLWDWGEGGSTYTVIRRNETYGSSTTGIAMVGGTGTDTFYGHLVYQNVVVETCEDTWRAAVMAKSADNTSIGLRYFNNTLYNNYRGGFYSRADTNVDLDFVYLKNCHIGLDNFTSDEDLFARVANKTNGTVGGNFFAENNLYWTVAGDPSAAVKWMDTNEGYYNWTDWKTRGNDGSPPILQDPSFVDAGNNDFELNPSSPAINEGGFLSTVAAADGSGTTITVADPYWFHGDYGLVDADGTEITGMEITFYDGTNGLQHRTITSDEINHGAGTFVVNASVTWIYDDTSAATLADPTKTTQIALTTYGTKPDIGYFEYDEPPGENPENDFSNDPNCLAHAILDDATNSGPTGATDNFTNAGTTTFVGGGAVLNGTDQYLWIDEPGLSTNIVDDFTVYASFTFTDELLGADQVLASENDYGEAQIVWVLVVDDSAGSDVVQMSVGFDGGADAKVCTSTYDLANGTRQYAFGQYNDGTDTVYIYIYNASGTLVDTETCNPFFGAETQNVEDVEFCIGCDYNNPAAADFFKGTMYEIAVTKDLLDATERSDIVKGEYSNPAGSFLSGSCADATAVGSHSITLVSDVEVVGIHGDDVDDLPYISVTLDYLGPALYPYVSSSDTNSTWPATLIAGMRVTSIVLPANIVLPNNATLTDLQDNPIALSLAAVDLTAQKIAIPSSFTVSSINTPGVYDHWVPGDHLWMTGTEAINTAVAGTAALPITLHIQSPPGTPITDNWAIDENYWNIEGHRRTYNGTITDTGNGTTTGFSRASSGTLPAGAAGWMPLQLFLED